MSNDPEEEPYFTGQKCGYTFCAKAGTGVLRIAKGSLVLLQGRRMTNNRVEGSVVSAECSTATTQQPPLYKASQY